MRDRRPASVTQQAAKKKYGTQACRLPDEWLARSVSYIEPTLQVRIPYIPRILHVASSVIYVISATLTDLEEQNLLPSLEEIRLFRLAACDRPNGPRLVACFFLLHGIPVLCWQRVSFLSLILHFAVPTPSVGSSSAPRTGSALSRRLNTSNISSSTLPGQISGTLVRKCRPSLNVKMISAYCSPDS